MYKYLVIYIYIYHIYISYIANNMILGLSENGVYPQMAILNHSKGANDGSTMTCGVLTLFSDKPVSG